MTDAYQLSHVAFRYGETTALSIPEQAIAANSLTALIGPNGSGKSTLLNILAFLYPPSQGELLYFDTTVTEKQLPGLRRRIAYLPQKPYLFRGSVEDNLKLALKIHGIPARQHRERMRQALQELDIRHLGWQPSHTLSGGELQKAALARAILTEPEVLLMDEPFSFLDHESEQLLIQFMVDFQKESGVTVIFSTHNRLQGLALANHALSLVQGKAVNTTLINVFHGHLEKQLFKTGKIEIYLADTPEQCHHISIDPQEIVLSRQPLVSSMRNQFPGKVSSIAEEKGNIRVSVNAGEQFQALITHNALAELHIKPGSPVWVHFKSNAVIAI